MQVIHLREPSAIEVILHQNQTFLVSRLLGPECFKSGIFCKISNESNSEANLVPSSSC